MKSIVITGANSGIGFACTMQMAIIAPDEQIILACRNVQAGDEAIRKIKQKASHKHLICLPLNLASLESIRDFKKAFLQLPDPSITALVNDAGFAEYRQDGLYIRWIRNYFRYQSFGGILSDLAFVALHRKNGSITFTASDTHDPTSKTAIEPPVFTTGKTLAFPEEVQKRKRSLAKGDIQLLNCAM